MHRPHMASGGRYPVLRALAILELVAAGLLALGGIIASVYFASVDNTATRMSDKLVIALVGVSATFFVVVFTLAFAELIKLLIDIEHNTRIALSGMEGRAAPAETASASYVPSGDGGRINRISQMTEEESAEAALIRGH